MIVFYKVCHNCFLKVNRKMFVSVPITKSLSYTHTKKRGTFSVFLSQGVWRYLTNRITKSPRLYSVSIFAIFLLVLL